MKFSRFAIIVLAIAALSSCKKEAELSRTTGWGYNDEAYGGIIKTDYQGMKAAPNMIFIPGGKFTFGGTQDQVLFEWDNAPREVTVSSFYMDQTEVSNIDYLEYLYWLSRVFNSNRIVYTRALPDTLVWRSPLSYNEPMVKDYLRHPAYQNYPVVGVSWTQAKDYCKWRTDRVNEGQLVATKALKNIELQQTTGHLFTTETYLDGSYKGIANTEENPFIDLSPNSSQTGDIEKTRRVRIEDGVFFPEYALPTEAQWEYAALGLVGNILEENVTERRFYPWNGNFVRLKNPKDVEHGRLMANFKRGRGDYMGIAYGENDGFSRTAPVGSFYPNDFGLYNMAGNVSEWVFDVYRPFNSIDMSDFNPVRGNQFTVQDRQMGTDDFGRAKQRPVDPVKDNLSSRRNYRKSDYRNYRDGDYHSTLEGSRQTGTGGTKTTSAMYVSSGSNPTSLISDEARVYKGGSWKDRAFFLSPGERRFLDQNLATDFIGFRCAMNSIDEPSY